VRQDVRVKSGLEGRTHKREEAGTEREKRNTKLLVEEKPRGAPQTSVPLSKKNGKNKNGSPRPWEKGDEFARFEKAWKDVPSGS